MNEPKEPKKDSLAPSAPSERAEGALAPQSSRQTDASKVKDTQQVADAQPSSDMPEDPFSEQSNKKSEDKSKDEPYWWYLFANKKVWVGIIGLFFFLYFTAVVPAGNVPFLRNLVRMMGYSDSEAESMSLLGALLGLSEHRKRAEEESLREVENRLKTQRQLSEDGTMSSSSADGSNKFLTASIDWDAINRSRRGRGLSEDSVSEVGSEMRGDASALPVALDGVGADVRGAVNAGSDTLSENEVYFGSVLGGVERNKNDGYETSKLVAKMANAPVRIDSDSVDWIGQSAAKAFWAESGVADLLQQVADQKGGGFAMKTNLREVGNQRPRRDMHYAWITSRAGARARNIWLMKTLASAGFLGADLDRQMLSITAVGGLSFDEDAVELDLENIEKRLEMEKKCEEVVNDSQDINKNVKAMNDNIEVLNDAFPSKCDGSESSEFLGKIDSIIAACQEINESYTKLREGCQIQAPAGHCNLDSVKERFVSFQQTCAAEKNKCNNEMLTPEEQASCVNNYQSLTRENLGSDGEYSKDEVQGLITGDTTSVNPDGSIAPNPFVATTDWKATLQDAGWNELKQEESEE